MANSDVPENSTSATKKVSSRRVNDSSVTEQVLGTLGEA